MAERPLRSWDHLTTQEKNDLYDKTKQLLRLARAELPLSSCSGDYTTPAVHTANNRANP